MGRKVLRFHGHEIDLQPNPIGRLNKECVQGKDLKDEKIVFMATVFVKTRFFHRIKVLNNEAKLKEKIRSVKQQSQFMFWFDNKYLFYNKPFPFIYCNQGMLFLFVSVYIIACADDIKGRSCSCIYIVHVYVLQIYTQIRVHPHQNRSYSMQEWKPRKTISISEYGSL